MHAARWGDLAGGARPIGTAGWPAFNLNEKQHRESIRRMAGFDSEIVAVGHGEPIRSGGERHVRDLVDGLERGHGREGRARGPALGTPERWP